VVALYFEICTAKIPLFKVARKECETKCGLYYLPIFAVWDLAIYEEYLFISLCERGNERYSGNVEWECAS